MRIDRALTGASRLIRDARAVRQGRIAERIHNRLIGRLIAWATRGLWR